MDKILKAIAVNLGCLVFGTIMLILFLMGLSSKGGLAPWLYLAVLIVIIFLWIYGNLMIFGKKKDTVYEQGQLKTVEDYQKALERMDKKCFRKQIRDSEEQLERLQTKEEQISDALRKYFGGSQISYSKYMHSVTNITAIYLDNLQKIMNRIAIFDYNGYKKIMDQHQEYTSAFDPYKESIEYVNQKIEDNETILNSLDHLMLEISKLNDSPKALEDMSAMREIQDLIEHTKLYKHD